MIADHIKCWNVWAAFEKERPKIANDFRWKKVSSGYVVNSAAQQFRDLLEKAGEWQGEQIVAAEVRAELLKRPDL